MTAGASPRQAARRKIRLALAALLVLSNVALLVATPFFFFVAAGFIMFILSILFGFVFGFRRMKDANLARARMQTAGPAILLGAVILAVVTISVLHVHNPDSYEVLPALMFAAIIWGGASSFLAGILLKEWISLSAELNPRSRDRPGRST